MPDADVLEAVAVDIAPLRVAVERAERRPAARNLKATIRPPHDREMRDVRLGLKLIDVEDFPTMLRLRAFLRPGGHHLEPFQVGN
jgi:hypothetical protein